MISSASGDTSHMLKHLSMQHGLKFQECHAFDTRRRAAASQPSSMSVTKGKYPILIILATHRQILHNFSFTKKT